MVLDGTPSATQDNTTYPAAFCPQIASDTLEVIINQVFNGNQPLYFTLPDCLYSNPMLSSLTSLRISGVLVTGNSTFPDPVERLTRSLPLTSLSVLVIANSFFVPFGASFAGPFECTSCLQHLTQLPSATILEVFSTQLNSTLNGLGTTWGPRLSSISFADNLLRGTIPQTLFSGFSDSVSLSLSKNRLTGSIPGNLLTPVTSASRIRFEVSSNTLTGSLPPNLLNVDVPASITSIHFDASSNQLSGILPSGSFFGLPKAVTRLDFLFFSVSANDLTGTLPEDWLMDYQFANLTILNIQFQQNMLSGNLDANLFAFAMPRLTSIVFLISENPQLGSFSPSLISSIGGGYARDAPRLDFSLDMSCNLTGPLSLTSNESSPTPISALYLTASINKFASLVIDSTLSQKIRTLVILRNYELTGVLPDGLFNATSSLRILSAASTKLSGNMPLLSLPSIQTLLLSNTSINFCEPENRTSWTTSGSCALLQTRAYLCPSLYPNCSVSPPSPPPVAVSQCSSTSPLPETSWTCVGGIWTSIGTINVPTLTIPSGSTETVVTGNLTSSSVVITGTGSTLVLQGGCPTNLTTITITLTDEDLKQIGKTLSQALLVVNLNLSCSGLNDIGVNTHVLGSSCRKVTTSKTVSSGTISALFSVSSSSCNTWWIILVSVLVPVVVILVLVVVLLVIFVPSVRNFFRPYSARKASKGSVS